MRKNAPKHAPPVKSCKPMDLFTQARPLKFLIVQATPSKLIKYLKNSYVRKQNRGSTRPFESSFSKLIVKKRKTVPELAYLKYTQSELYS
jgi:hypothetical protein